ncbi:MAG TPA: flagellar filament capping protein FliD, partial [Planctomycetota bacterium]|nr:flagellar filament capping protein FliD [Planctomycetota bacterium]
MAGIDGVSFSGIASGIDTKSIVDALVAIEKKPGVLAQQKQDKLKSVAGLYGTLATKLKALKDKAAALKLVSQAAVYVASSSDATKVAATATSGAQPGTHEITVTQLAQAERELGGAKNGGSYGDADTTTVGTGSVTITYAGTTTAIDVTGKSLTEVASAINGASLGVSASVMNVGTSESPSYKLVVSGQETGSTKSIGIAADAGVDLEFTQLTTAQDAELTVDGVPIVRSSNTVSDAISGVTFDLKDEGTVTVTLTQDSSAVKKKIQDLVDAYNDVVQTLNANGKYDAATKIAGPLFGDATAKQIGSSLTTIALGNGAEYADDEAFNSLA